MWRHLIGYDTKGNSRKSWFIQERYSSNLGSLKGTNTLHPKREIRNKQKEEYDKDAFSHLFLFNLYSKIILKGWEYIPRFIIGGHNHNNIILTNNT